MSASRFKDFVTDPAAVASELRRPMPEKPYRATRLGTLFHSWVEERSGYHGSFEELDTLATESDIEDDRLDAAALARLQATFEKSAWAHRKPIDVEREIHLVLDGQIIVCKIDAVYEIYGCRRRGRATRSSTGRPVRPRRTRRISRRSNSSSPLPARISRWKGIARIASMRCSTTSRTTA